MIEYQKCVKSTLFGKLGICHKNTQHSNNPGNACCGHFDLKIGFRGEWSGGSEICANQFLVSKNLNLNFSLTFQIRSISKVAHVQFFEMRLTQKV